MDDKLNETLKGIWDSLTDEQKEQAKACETLDELAALAASAGIELPDEALDAVAGGYIFKGSYSDGAPAYVVIDDKGGVHENYRSLEDAQEKAQSSGYSTEVIDEKKLKKIRGRC